MYRCRDCFKSPLFCNSCCVSSHATSPFHRVQMFNGCYYIDQLGLTLDVRQHPGDCVAISKDMERTFESDCDLSDNDDTPGYQRYRQGTAKHGRGFTHHLAGSHLTIVSSTGIFRRAVKWCQCANCPDAYVQLLCAKLFPASFQRPATAFTFEVLDHFRLDALECKTAAMNFMCKIARISNEAFPDDVPVCIPIFSHIHPHSQ